MTIRRRVLQRLSQARDRPKRGGRATYARRMTGPGVDRDVTETIGDRLLRFRKEHGLTQKDLAGDRYSSAFVSIVESGRRRPSEEAVRYFAEQLGVDAEELLTGRSAHLGVELEMRLVKARHAVSTDDLAAAEQAYASAREDAASNGYVRLEAKALLGLARCAERAGDVDQSPDAPGRGRGVPRGRAAHGQGAGTGGQGQDQPLQRTAARRRVPARRGAGTARTGRPARPRRRGPAAVRAGRRVHRPGSAGSGRRGGQRGDGARRQGGRTRNTSPRCTCRSPGRTCTRAAGPTPRRR